MRLSQIEKEFGKDFGSKKGKIPKQLEKIFMKPTRKGVKMKPMKNNHWKELASFTAYLEEHPELRFWQAIRAWSGAVAIWYQGTGEPTELSKRLPNDIIMMDTFFWTNFESDPSKSRKK